jgi:hypothetical protein
MSDESALASRLRRSAESVGLRGGHLVPLHYGSAAGELALCMRSVGLVDREDLRVLMVSARPEELDRLTADVLDGILRPGETASVGEEHWGRLGPDQAIVAVPANSTSLLCEELLRVLGTEEATIEATDLQAIGVIGPATAGLLTDLGAYGALAGVNGRGRIAGAAAGGIIWMLLDDASALALVGAEDALAAWNSLTEAGRRFDIGYVGAEAAERFEAIRCRTGESVRH